MKHEKKKVAIFAASGCRGCEHAILDVHQQVQSFTPWMQIVFWPYLLGSDPQALADLGAIDVCFFAGAVTTAAERAMAQQLRAKAQVVVACGSCAAFGGMPALMNLKQRATGDGPSGRAIGKDDGSPALPVAEHRVAALEQVVAVDYGIPGCQPTQPLLWAAFQALVCGPRAVSRLAYASSRLPAGIANAVTAGIAPPKGAFFAGENAVCASCSRIKEEKKIKSVIRPYEKYEESGRCLLEQGLLCMGIATREGCGGLCPSVGQPCRGCFGKVEAVYDPGAKMVSALGSTFVADTLAEVEQIAAKMQDLSGTFYRFTSATQCALLDKE
jgi:F420-non-reducing hydrogenase small subunit